MLLLFGSAVFKCEAWSEGSRVGWRIQGLPGQGLAGREEEGMGAIEAAPQSKKPRSLVERGFLIGA